jgi:hypothetical protein
MSAVAKRARLGELGELEHGGNVGGRQRAKFSVGRQSWRAEVDGAAGADHLVESAAANQRPAGWRRWGLPQEECNDLTGTDECAEGIVVGGGLVGDSAERANVGRKAFGPVISQCQRTMFRAKRTPDGVVEQSCI